MSQNGQGLSKYWLFEGRRQANFFSNVNIVGVDLPMMRFYESSGINLHLLVLQHGGETLSRQQRQILPLEIRARDLFCPKIGFLRLDWQNYWLGFKFHVCGAVSRFVSFFHHTTEVSLSRAGRARHCNPTAQKLARAESAV